MRVATYKEDQYDLTDSFMGVNKTLVVRVNFISQMALAVGRKWFHNILSLIMSLVVMDFVCWLGLLHKISTSFCILVSGLCLLHYNFYSTLFLLPPIDEAWSQRSSEFSTGSERRGGCGVSGHFETAENQFNSIDRSSCLFKTP
jgi:hypothetical protein